MINHFSINFFLLLLDILQYDKILPLLNLETEGVHTQYMRVLFIASDANIDLLPSFKQSLV
jgi:hypothetical protein